MPQCGHSSSSSSSSSSSDSEREFAAAAIGLGLGAGLAYGAHKHMKGKKKKKDKIKAKHMPVGHVVVAPVVGAPMVGAPVVGAPMVGAPMVGAPMVGAPMVGAPMVGAPMVGAPMVGVPIVGAPMVGGPMVGAPGDPLWGYFSAVAGPDQQISATELQTALTSAGMSGHYKPFSLETCRTMVAMLDKDHSGQMGFSEFKELTAAINMWKTAFMDFDSDRSGTVDGGELKRALTTFGYNLSPPTVQSLVKRYSTPGGVSITFDDFVACLVRLRFMTDSFRLRDTQQNGNAVFAYDDFITVTMSA